MRATQPEVEVTEPRFELTKTQATRSNQTSTNTSRETLQSMTAAMDKMLENILQQGQINTALVKRMLTLEKRVEELTKSARVASATGTAAVAPATAHAAVNAPAAAPAAQPASQTIMPPAMPQRDPLPMYMGDSIAMCRVLNSFRMYVDTRDTMITPQLITTGMWEPALTRLTAQKLKAGMTVVDVGANVGYFTLLAAAVTGPQGRVVAFEPEPRNAEILERNLELNGIWERVRVHRHAVLNERKKLDLHRNPRNQGAHTLFVADPARSPFPRIPVETVALDDVIETPVDFMKIDAEGSEPLIFRGMKRLLDRSPKLQILMEFNTVTMKNAAVEPGEFFEQLMNLGFRMHLVTPQATLTTVRKEILIQQPLSTVFLTR